MKWTQLIVLLGLAMAAPMTEARPKTSTSCYTVRVTGTRTLTRSLSAQTRRPTVTSTPVRQVTSTVTRRRTTTEVVSTVTTVRVTSPVTAVTQTVTPTTFTVSVPTITTVAPVFVPTQTQILITPSAGTFTSSSITFTAPPGPTLAGLAPREEPEERSEEDSTSPCPRGEEAFEEPEERATAGEPISAGNAQSAARKLRGRRIYCRRIVRLDPTTVRATRTRTVTVSTTVRPRTTVTSTVTAVATSTVFNNAVGVIVTAAPTTRTITAPAITVTSTPTAATVTTTSTILTPQPTLVVPVQRSTFCGPLARPFNSNLIGAVDVANQGVSFVEPAANQDCCDVSSNTPGAVAYVSFGAQCVLLGITATPPDSFCTAGNPATSVQLNAACDATCPAGGFLQCGAGA